MEKCRLCYDNSNPEMCQHIFNTKFEPPIWEIIKQLSNLMITKNDPYTKSICGQCLHDLIKYSTFRHKILDTDYRIQHEKDQLLESTSDNCDYFEVPSTPATTVSDDFIIKEEEIEIEEHPLEIEDECNENLYNSSDVVIDKQNVKKLTILSDIIINNDKITTCSSNCTSRNDNNDTNESQSSKWSTDDENGNDNDVITIDDNEKSDAKDVGTSKSFNDKSSDSNGKKEELNVEMNTNKKKFYTTNSQPVNTKAKTTDKISESTKRRRNAGNIDLKVQTNERELRSSSRTQTDAGPSICNICQKQFVFKSHLNTHLRTHTGETPHKCIVCEKSFESREAVKRHIRVHTGEKPYHCNSCDEAFPFKQGLTVHLKTHLVNEKEYMKCDVCGKQFIREHNLDVHMRVHTGEKPYKCTVCNEAFALNCNLKQHYKQMHKKS